MIARSLAAHHSDSLGEDFLTLQASRGIGMALVRDGVPVGGLRSSANEFGHMTYIENGALAAAAKRAVSKPIVPIMPSCVQRKAIRK